MKNNRLFCCIFATLSCLPLFLSAQCGVTVDAGEDIYVCDLPAEVQLHGAISGDYIRFAWIPFDMSQDGILDPVVSVSQPMQYVLSAWHLDESTNLIVNGDFEQGNTGFSSNYTYSPGNLVSQSTYDVLPNPESANDEFAACTDHTSGSGNMFAGNASQSTSNLVWCQTVAVTPYTDYILSYWATTLSGTPRNIFMSTGVAPQFGFTPQSTPCVWEKAESYFNSGNYSSISMCINVVKPHPLGEKFGFAIDDIVMNPVCRVSDTVKIKTVSVVANISNTAYTIPCDGYNITLDGSGSSTGPGYVYNWDTPDGNIVSGQNTLYPVVNAPGSYILTVSFTNAVDGECAKTATVEVNIGNELSVSITAPETINCNNPNIFLTAQASYPSIYHWTAGPGGHIVSGANGTIVVVNQPGDYTVLATNVVTGCTAEATVSIGEPVLPVANATASPITCAQQQVTLSGAGSSTGPNITYAWSTASGNIVSGQDSLYALADTAGVYVLLVTNTSNGCSKTDTIAVTTNNASLPVNIQPADTITCLLNQVILATDSATAGVHFIYAWTTNGGNIVSGADSLSPIVNAPGLYILLVTDTLNACTGTDTVTVAADNNAVIAVANAPDEITCLNTSVILNADGSSDNPQLVYQWSTSGGNIVSGGDSPNPAVNAPGVYQLLLTNPSNGCTATDLAEVTADLALPVVDLSVSAALNCHNASVNLTNTGTGDPALLNHEWTLPDGYAVNTGSNPVLNTNQFGNYALLVSNIQNGCTNSATATIVQHDNVVASVATQQNVTCFGAADGAVSITAGGGDGAYTYLWSNDATTPAINNLGAGAYTVTIADGENCTATASVSITQPVELFANASATPESAIGVADGTATANPAGGIPPYDFFWDNGESTQTITGLETGPYTVTVTDANGCTAVQTVFVSHGDCNLIADFESVNPLCNGTSSGQATALPLGGSAPFTYSWTSGSTEQTATGLAAGTYGVTVIDVNSCAFSGAVTLIDPPLLTLAVQNVANATCTNSPDGSATVFASGGTGSTAIEWSNGQSGLVASGLVAGDYIASATDANGCTATTTVSIHAIDQEAPDIQANPVTVSLGTSGAVELTLQNLGATVTDNCGVASIQITPDEFDCFDLGEQQVIITAQDDSGNNSTQTVTVTFVDTQAPVLECPGNITRCNDDNVVLYAAPVAIDNCLVLGGTFTLIAGLPSGSPYPQGTTAHTYTFADISGNIGACSFDVTVLSPLVVSLDGVMHDVDNQNIGGIQVTVGGSMPGYSYEWLQNGGMIATTEDLEGIGMGLYSLQVTDAFGCKTEAGPYEVTSLVQTSNPGWADYIAVYPNPSAGRVYALLPDELVNTEVDFVVFDGTGRRVLEQKCRLKKQVVLDLSGFADGLYSILIRVEQGQVLRKIVISR